MTKHIISIIGDSNSSRGALNTTSEKDRFSVSLYEPIKVPANAKNCVVEVESSSIWNTIYNVFSSSDATATNPQNNNFVFTYATVGYLIPLPSGTYDLSQIQQAVNVGVRNGASGLPDDTFEFIANDATGGVDIRVNTAGIVINFAYGNTIALLLGFAEADTSASGTAPSYFQSAGVATLDLVKYLKINSNITSEGLRINSTYKQTLDIVYFTSPVGSLNIDEKLNKSRCQADYLIGGSLKNLQFYLTDQDDNAVNTRGKDWQVKCSIIYEI